MPDGVLRSASGFAYQVTPEDMLWLARAAKYEGRGDARFTIWSLAQRFVEIHGPRFPTLKSVVLAYAQPVNPIWRRDGAMCRPGGAWFNRCNDAGYCPCAENRLAVRDRAAVDRAPEQLALVEAWVRGEVVNEVPRASEYAAPWLVQIKLEDGSLVRVVKASENWYATTHTTEGWPRSFVTISGTGEPRSWALAFGLIVTAVTVGGLLGAGGVLAIGGRAPRRRRRR